MKKFLLLSATALVMLAPSAFAADIVPEPAPVANWTAIHIGVGGGGGYNSYDAESNLFIDPWDSNIPDFIGISSDEGKFYGFGTVEIGADYQFDNTPFVIGILANYDFNGKSEADASSFTTSEDGIIGAEVQSELDDTWFVGGRAGFVVNETSLIYALGGYTWAKGKVKGLNGFDLVNGDDFGEVDEDDNVDGWTVGAGLEQLLTESISLKIEYRHDFLDNIQWDQAAYDPEWGGVDEDNTSEGEVKFSRDTVRAVLSWRFGMGL